MRLAFVLLWILHSVGSALPVRHLKLNDYDLAVPIPAGWSMSTIGSLGVEFRRDGASVTLDWYQPTRYCRYKNFDRRVRAEIHYREKSGTVFTRRYHIGALRAVEARSLDSKKNVFVETYLDVPDPNEPSGGELFVITLEGGSGRAGASDLEAYHKILRTLRIAERDE